MPTPRWGLKLGPAHPVSDSISYPTHPPLLYGPGGLHLVYFLCGFLGYKFKDIHYNSDTHETSFVHYCSFSLIFIKITINYWVASLRLPAKYPQVPALLIGQIETLIFRIPLICTHFVNLIPPTLLLLLPPPNPPSLDCHICPRPSGPTSVATVYR